jgi:hypothetical protein
LIRKQSLKNNSDARMVERGFVRSPRATHRAAQLESSGCAASHNVMFLFPVPGMVPHLFSGSLRRL